MAYEKQFAIKEVASLNIVDYSTNKPITYIPYASETSIMSESSQLKLFGGWSNMKLLSFDYDKNVKVGFKLPLTDMSLLAHMLGTDLQQGVGTAHNDERLISNGGLTPTITLSETPLDDTLKLFAMDSEYQFGNQQVLGNPLNQDEYSINGKTITLNSTTGYNGRLFLAMYDFNVLNDSHVIQAFVNKFSKYVRITGEGTWRNIVTQEDEIIKFDFKKCKIKPNFNLTQSSTNATFLEIEADLYFKPFGLQKVYATMTTEHIQVSDKYYKRFIVENSIPFITSDIKEFLVAL